MMRDGMKGCGEGEGGEWKNFKRSSGRSNM
jgi:hypothetical protein